MSVSCTNRNLCKKQIKERKKMNIWTCSVHIADPKSDFVGLSFMGDRLLRMFTSAETMFWTNNIAGLFCRYDVLPKRKRIIIIVKTAVTAVGFEPVKPSRTLILGRQSTRWVSILRLPPVASTFRAASFHLANEYVMERFVLCVTLAQAHCACVSYTYSLLNVCLRCTNKLFV